VEALHGTVPAHASPDGLGGLKKNFFMIARSAKLASYSGIVELSGSVRSSDERSEATSVALSVDGVETVLNVLRLEER